MMTFNMKMILLIAASLPSGRKQTVKMDPLCFASRSAGNKVSLCLFVSPNNSCLHSNCIEATYNQDVCKYPSIPVPNGGTYGMASNTLQVSKACPIVDINNEVVTIPCTFAGDLEVDILIASPTGQQVNRSCSLVLVTITAGSK
jgi:hypothetical protein